MKQKNPNDKLWLNFVAWGVLVIVSVIAYVWYPKYVLKQMTGTMPNREVTNGMLEPWQEDYDYD